MKTFAPDYYKDFKCIADKCKHTCCVGWEIDIDSDTLGYYKSITTLFGKRLRDGITEYENTASFILSEDERCPFLNSNGLCDIITELGEESLCQICRDHPRFRNYFTGRIEIGLGLCCEEAARIILNREEKMTLVEIDDDGYEEESDPEEEEFFKSREVLFSILQNRDKKFSARLSEMLNYCNLKEYGSSNSELADIFLRLERLDEKWSEKVEKLKTFSEKTILKDYDEKIEIAFEQLSVYFLYRHLSCFFDEGDAISGVIFTYISMIMIMKLCAVDFSENENPSIEAIAETARMYSSEIEYSDENIQNLLDMI